MPRPTLYEFAGGAPAFLALVHEHHARCLADPELTHPFSHPGQHPQHVERLALYWGEVLGGPPRYSAECERDQAGLLHMHSGNGDMSDLAQRFLRVFDESIEEIGMPDDAAFRAAMHSYMAWAVAEFNAHPEPDAQIPARPVPRWGWDGLQPA